MYEYVYSPVAQSITSIEDVQVQTRDQLITVDKCNFLLLFDFLLNFFFLYSMWRNMLPSHASAEACLTNWPNAQPQGWD